jgi:hypothetical protein
MIPSDWNTSCAVGGSNPANCGPPTVVGAGVDEGAGAATEVGELDSGVVDSGVVDGGEEMVDGEVTSAARVVELVEASPAQALNAVDAANPSATRRYDAD